MGVTHFAAQAEVPPQAAAASGAMLTDIGIGAGVLLIQIYADEDGNDEAQ